MKSKIKINDLLSKVKEINENDKKIELLSEEISILNKEKEERLKTRELVYTPDAKTIEEVARLRGKKVEEIR